jgi:hypothetical protein
MFSGLWRELWFWVGERDAVFEGGESDAGGNVLGRGGKGVEELLALGVVEPVGLGEVLAGDGGVGLLPGLEELQQGILFELGIGYGGDPLEGGFGGAIGSVGFGEHEGDTGVKIRSRGQGIQPVAQGGGVLERPIIQGFLQGLRMLRAGREGDGIGGEITGGTGAPVGDGGIKGGSLHWWVGEVGGGLEGGGGRRGGPVAE